MAKKMKESGEGVDRLSNLPDDILHYLLSFLETKDAVQTSVLSKKWKSLWAFVPGLNFDSQSFRRLTDFKKFVYKVLEKRDPDSSVAKIRFFRRLKVDYYLVGKVIQYAAVQKAHHLIIQSNDDSFRIANFSSEISSCQLKTLQLKFLSLWWWWPLLENLTTLHLNRCSFPDDCDLAKFPNLTKLCLISCYFPKVKVVKIYGPQLLHLSLESITFGCRRENLFSDSKVEVSAPKLTFLSYKDSAAVDFSLIDLPSLQQVNVCVSMPNDTRQNEKAKINLFKFFQGLRNADFVTLFSSTIQALAVFIGTLDQYPSPFSRLKSLKLEEHPRYKSVPTKVMTYLTGGSPHAEVCWIPKVRQCFEDSDISENGFLILALSHRS